MLIPVIKLPVATVIEELVLLRSLLKGEWFAQQTYTVGCLPWSLLLAVGHLIALEGELALVRDSVCCHACT